MSNLNRNALRDIRTLKGWSISEMARLMGLNSGTLHRIETGVRKPSLAMVIRIADTLGVDVASITYPVINCPECAGKRLQAAA